MPNPVRVALLECDPAQKCALVAALPDCVIADDVENIPDNPGRPLTPTLIDPRQVPRRRLGSVEGRAALIHAIAHIEFNAINLGLDAADRFSDMPDKFYQDWIRVAKDEARHFQMLNTRLQDLGFAYGDFDAHNGLWDMAIKTKDNVLERMALVPRVLEARGLDVTPSMIQRLLKVGDTATADVLQIIWEEEHAHVEIGTHWFRHCCEIEGVDPEKTFLNLLADHSTPMLKPPFEWEARADAGFSESEISQLKALYAPT